MKKSYYVSRKVVVETNDQYKPVTYTHSAGREYDSNEMEQNTIIDSVEFSELAEEVDIAQRRFIEQDTGVTKLAIDKMKILPLKKRLLLKGAKGD